MRGGMGSARRRLPPTVRPRRGRVESVLHQTDVNSLGKEGRGSGLTTATPEERRDGRRIICQRCCYVYYFPTK